jgi:hypothetical protein
VNALRGRALRAPAGLTSASHDRDGFAQTLPRV